MTNEASYPLNNKLNGNKNKFMFAQNKGNSSSKLQTLSYHISKSVGDFFYKLGYNVARNPFKTIFLAWLACACCALGFLNFKQEREPMRLWVPEDSQFLINAKTVMDKFGEGFRKESVLLVSKSNILTPEVMEKLLRINEAIKNITYIGEDGNESSLDDVCFKIPSIAKYTVTDDEKRVRREIDDKKKSSISQFFGVFKDFGQKQYCKIVNGLKKVCMNENFLEIWKTNATRMKDLTTEEIIEKVNSLKRSPETGHLTNFKAMLGGVERDENGRIISAKSIITNWMLRVNFSAIDYEKTGNNAGTEDFATIDIHRFEEKYEEVIRQLKAEIENDDLTLYYGSGKSFGDLSAQTMFQDIDKVVYGVIFMMFYMILVLSRFSWVELRCSLAAVGLLNVGMAYISGCGLGSLFFSYSPVHTSLFFIIMGLGVDDIFVVASCLRKISAADQNLSLPEKIGKTMSKAGTSITITSLTDIIAFLVGGSTVLPSLKSFCIFAAFCICINYLYVITFFVACLVIDEKRIKMNRNGCCPLIVHKENKIWAEPKYIERFIKYIYSKFVLKPFGKVLVVIIAIAITAFSTDRVFKIKQKFDPMWFIPADSYFAQFVYEHRDLYPSRGYEAGIYFTNFNFTENLPKLYEISNRLKNRTDIIDRVQTWVHPFGEYVEDDFDITKPNAMTSEDFQLQLSKFLFSTQGGQYQANFKFKEPLECGKPAKEIKISSINFNFRKFSEREEYIPAKKSLETLIKEINFDQNEKTEVFLFGRIFGNWITDEIIDEEIFRNISLALIGVFFCTVVMIVNLQVCAMIFLCVLMSLVSVGGFMQLWGLTLDLVTCISLQLSVGLCIDCAAHIGHTFLTISQGDGTARAQKTVETIGDAVWQGGMSTMLSVSLLAFSDAYTYKTFFKVFTIVVIFALFYGTFFLPVALSILNPKPYDSEHIEEQRKDRELSIIRMPDEIDTFLKPDMNGSANCDKE